MGMSTHIVGYRETDEEWRKMREAYVACVNAGIDPPSQILDFFEYEDPRNLPDGIEIKISDATEEFESDYKKGYSVYLDRLPAGVKVIRFYNAY